MSERDQPGGAGAGAAAEASFDARLARLEAIVGELEDGDLGLEPAIERYREGVLLLRECQRVLSGYRRQVEELSRDAEQTLEPYAADPDHGERPERPERPERGERAERSDRERRPQGPRP